MKLTQSHPVRQNHHNIDIGLDYAKGPEYRKYVLRFVERVGKLAIVDLDSKRKE